MYEYLELDLDLKLMFMVTGAYYKSGPYACEPVSKVKESCPACRRFEVQKQCGLRDQTESIWWRL